jgi:hypothetical protein
MNTLTKTELAEVKDFFKYFTNLKNKDYIASKNENNEIIIDVLTSITFKKNDMDHHPKSFPFKFNNINGDFKCLDFKLTTLKNGPEFVDGSMSIGNKIEFKLLPKKIKNNFMCSILGDYSDINDLVIDLSEDSTIILNGMISKEIQTIKIKKIIEENKARKEKEEIEKELNKIEIKNTVKKITKL